MKNKNYLIILALWIITFGKNIFENIILVDYAPATSFKVLNNILITNNFTSGLNILNILRTFIPKFFFQLSILATMFISYYYIKKLTKHSLLTSIIFFFNPFVYTRIMIGQLGILIAYLLLPIFLYYLNQRDFTKLAIIMTIIGSLTPHFFIITILILIIHLIYFKNIKIKQLLIFTLILTLLSLFWLQGLFSNSILQEINQNDKDFFAPKLSEGIPAIAKTLTMYGFWRESSFNTTYNLIPTVLWYILTFILVILLITGYYQKQDKQSKFFYTLFWVGLILGVGISHPYTKPIFDFLFQNIPFFNGFRDSHKFVALIAIAYAFLIPNITNKLKKPIVTLLIILLILTLNFTMINLNNQTVSKNYPTSYKELNTFLDKQTIQGKIIYLPWQTYLTYNWTKDILYDGRVSVPINEVSNYPIYEGPDDFGGNSGLRLDVSNCIKDKSQTCLENLGIQFIVQDKCTSYPKQEWLTNKVFENECLTIYETQGKSTTTIPTRFIMFTLISALTFIYLVLKQRNKKPKQQKTHKHQSILIVL